MTPQAALDAQIEKYRSMTGEERLKNQKTRSTRPELGG